DLEAVVDLLTSDAVRAAPGARVRIEGWGGAPLDGRLQALAGIGAKRLAGIRDSLAHRLGRVRDGATQEAAGSARGAAGGAPPVAELLDVDREYREKSAAGRLPRIAPRRFNPRREAWLPVLHAERGRGHYTAVFSNTVRAHELGKTDDWVVLYLDGGTRERQYTVVTAQRGPLAGRRVVRGREDECAALAPPAGANRGLARTRKRRPADSQT
ncbi:MAG: hypothetical protein AB1689_23740, partial [Thermodesulfobacteriota bacterium]